MRIAISGSHRTGKSTLLEALSTALPRYVTVDEPFYALEEEGHAFSHPPAVEDFAAQLERSIEDLNAEGDHVLFDRCPVDFLGYIAAHRDAGTIDLDAWIPRTRAALETLDLIVFVPIEARERIAFSSSDDEGVTRAAVDEKLKEILFTDAFELGLEVLTVEGEPERRLRTVLQRIRRGGAKAPAP